MTRDRQTKTRLTDEEKNAVEAAAKARGMSVAGYMRDVLLEDARETAEGVEAKIADLEAQKDELEAEKERHQERLDEVQERIDDVDERLDELRDANDVTHDSPQTETAQEAYERVADELLESPGVIADGHPVVEDAAEIHADDDPVQFLHDLYDALDYVEKDDIQIDYASMDDW
jgi:TolA-binding protein